MTSQNDEELRKKYPINTFTVLHQDELIEFIQIYTSEAVKRATAEAYESIRSSMMYHFAYSGRKTIKSKDIDDIAAPHIDSVTDEIYPEFR